MSSSQTSNDVAARLDAAIDEALDRRGGIDTEIGDLLVDLLSQGRSSLFERWTCEDEKCPGRPQWDKDLAGETWNAIHEAIERQWVDIARQEIRTRVLAFLEQHPEAQLRSEALAAA